MGDTRVRNHRAGFIVDGSWPIQTEQTSRMRALSSAALSSSVWLVCKKRPDTARPGWDTQVMEEMRKNIDIQLREFWDAGIRGPDFVWAATGPALEAYSKHPIVKKANAPGQIMTVSEFLHQVRRLVVDFVVGRVLSKDGNGSSEISLDDVTTYYLLHGMTLDSKRLRQVLVFSTRFHVDYQITRLHSNMILSSGLEVKKPKRMMMKGKRMMKVKKRNPLKVKAAQYR